MTVEEQLKKLEEKQAQLEAENATLKENQSKQNSYITTLERERKEANEVITKLKEVQDKGKNGKSPTAYDTYMRNKWRKDIVEDALASLKNNYDPKSIELLHGEVVEYCIKHMTDQTTSVDYAKRVFAMLYGQAIGDKTHPVYLHERGTPTPKPADPPPKPVPSLTPEQQRQMPPHTMTGGDNPGQVNVPNPENPSPYKNTKESAEALRRRLQNLGTDS